MTTALDTITGALRLLNVIAAGETASGVDASIGLTILNEMLEDWSTQELAIFTPQDQTFALVAGTASYTVGPSGTWVGFRPIQIDAVRALYQTAVYQVEELDNGRFNAIIYPAQTGVLPLVYNYDPTATNGTVMIWPVPTTVMPITISSNQQLAQIPTVGTTLTYPPGYARALRFNLARDLQGEYNTPLSPAALQIAATSLGHIKRANMKAEPAQFDPALTDGGGTSSRLANLIAGVW